MIPANNNGFLKAEIDKVKAEIELQGRNFIYAEDHEDNDEYSHFYFIGKYENREVIYDAVLYTLRLQHESELFEIAEHRAANHFPNYHKITYEEDENGNLKTLGDEEEEIGLFMAEVILELEEEEEVKVKERLELDIHLDFGIGIDACLHVSSITPQVIENFIGDFNNGTLKLDPTLYSFQTQKQEDQVNS